LLLIQKLYRILYRSTMISSIHMSILYTPVNLKVKTPQNHLLQLHTWTQLYDKRDDFSFTIANFPYICSNIPLSPAYGVYISKLIRYATACSTYDQSLSRSILLTDKLMLQGFLQSRLMSAFRKFYGRYNDLIYNYKISLSHMLSDIFHTNS
jgi:hypothetical protein